MLKESHGWDPWECTWFWEYRQKGDIKWSTPCDGGTTIHHVLLCDNASCVLKFRMIGVFDGGPISVLGLWNPPIPLGWTNFTWSLNMSTKALNISKKALNNFLIAFAIFIIF